MSAEVSSARNAEKHAQQRFEVSRRQASEARQLAQKQAQLAQKQAHEAQRQTRLARLQAQQHDGMQACDNLYPGTQASTFAHLVLPPSRRRFAPETFRHDHGA